MAGPIDVKRKEVLKLDTGYAMWPWPVTSHKTLTLDFLRWNFEIQWNLSYKATEDGGLSKEVACHEG